LSLSPPTWPPPLTPTRSPEGWDALRRAARDVVNAHGMDDHQALIDALIEAAANVEVGS
jgi:hypothetical protein